MKTIDPQRFLVRHQQADQIDALTAKLWYWRLMAVGLAVTLVIVLILK